MDLQDLTKPQLDCLKSVLRKYPNLKCSEVLDLLKNEEKRRNTPTLNGIEITKRFLNSYIRYEICDGLGSYEVWKVRRVDVDDDRKQYVLYPNSLIISNIDGNYSIDEYLEDITVETEDELKKFTVISKEEYDKEFNKALDHYMKLKNIE